ncbi:MAG: energy-coupling factor ABC transporter ATP-binding protein [Treponema sp.]|nr:energy-coupling factor ABC transporter ATP-binding protein [Treponema sp.]
MRGLRKTFFRPGEKDGGETAVLDGIDLDIRRGECLLLAGSNGSGKTLLTRILAGLAEPTEGTVRYRGRDLGTALKEGERNFRRELGIIFQDPDAQFVGETVEEDAAFGPRSLGMGRDEALRRARGALEKTGLWEKRFFAPRRLSGGEKRRLAAAGVLASGCRTVIMDEPFANLDWPGVVQTLRLVKTLKDEGAALIILTHELEKALAFADRLVILHGGRIREDGKPDAVLDRLGDEYGVRDPRRTYARAADCSWLP